ncbi:MAG: sensor histidine kinase [Lachnospiraceae bacterium]|nr:sensor histidine kinase [Lachnospiraceae bacterium]
MSIKKKVFITLLATITTVLFLSYLVIYGLFYRTLVSKIEAEQNTLISLNRNVIDSFIRSMDQTAILLVGDEAIGKYLSQEITDNMAKIRVSNGIYKQFSHYLSLQIGEENSFCQNTLFLNSKLPIADAFSSETLETASPWRSSNIYSNEQVTGQEWYQQTLNSSNKTHLFVNENTNEFCYAKKIQNNYYTGPFYPNGLAVIVIQVPLNRLNETLSMVPITPNSGFILLGEDSEVLYQSGGSLNLSSDLLPYLQSQNRAVEAVFSFRDTLTLDETEYITYYQPMDNGLSLVFFTPYSDIMEQVEKITGTYVAFSLPFIILAILLACTVSRKITKPLIQFSGIIASIDDTRGFNLDTLEVSKDLEMQILQNNFGKLISRVNTLIEDVQLQGEEQTKYRLRALQAQINPHFIYNAMDTVNWIALSKNEDEIAAIVSSISNLMRYSITAPDSLVSLQQELQNIQEYITIQQVRYGTPIELILSPGAFPEKIYIPKFTVQPLVENSILHGNYPSDTKIQITVTIQQQPDTIIIKIRDNGKGCEPELLNRYLAHEKVELSVSSGFGIRNVNERLQLHFGGSSGLSFTSDEAGQLIAVLTLCCKIACKKLHYKAREEEL